jgi:hypothetical protein
MCRWRIRGVFVFGRVFFLVGLAGEAGWLVVGERRVNMLVEA